jgi:putative NIF3 family GTP cyclohydrolase 1 type 2
MDRREFVKASMLSGAGIWLGANPTPAVARSAKGLTAGEVHEYLRSLGREWIDPRNTVDTFKSGRPEMPVNGIAVAWMSYFDALREAVAKGCNLFVTHEPTYYNHTDTDRSVFSFEVARRKKAFIEESGLTIIRCHDVWDRVPEIGIPDAWGRHLGWTKVVRQQTFYRVYELPPTSAGELAKHVAAKVAPLGQKGVQLIGPADKVIRTVAIGTGAITSLRTMIVELEADLALCTDDGFTYWSDGAMALDMGYPVIVVNHPCAEEIGMAQLANHLRERYPTVLVRHIAQKCMFATIQT